jgi:hypothetical protein
VLEIQGKSWIIKMLNLLISLLMISLLKDQQRLHSQILRVFVRLLLVFFLLTKILGFEK